MNYPLLTRLSITIWMVAGLTSILQAQIQEDVSTPNPFQIGLRGGILFSNVTFDQAGWDQEPETKPGADLAVIGKLALGEGNFALQPELHWMQKGYQISDATYDTFTYGKVVSTFYFIELPVLLRYDFGGSVKLFAVAGPSVGYFLGGTQDSDTYGSQSFDQSTFNRLEFGAHVGIGIGLGPIEIDVRYIHGWSDIAEGVSVVKNNAIGAGISYMF